MPVDAHPDSTDAVRLRQRLRQRLRVLLKLMLLLAAMAVIYVLFSAGFPGNDPTRGGPALRVDLNSVAPGEVSRLLWGSRPVIILHRTSEQIAALAGPASALRDAGSNQSVQPGSMKNAYRSASPQWFVALGSGTDLGCSLDYIPGPVSVAGTRLTGAFKDSCRGSIYDLAGRVLDGQQAGRNLVVPEYRLHEGEVVLGGN